jgi:hypothetical protein
MKSIALAALTLSTLATPAFAGPYVETKHSFNGTDEDYQRALNSGRIGYDKNMGAFTPYVEAGFGVMSPDGLEPMTFTVLEVGGKLKLKRNLSVHAKYENLYLEDDTTKWKVELGTQYRF